MGNFFLRMSMSASVAASVGLFQMPAADRITLERKETLQIFHLECFC